MESCRLSGVRITDKELGRGSYSIVFEVEYMGLKCAGKKVHDQIILDHEQKRAHSIIQGFQEECRLLSQLRHPNIVQFLGVCIQGERTPILVMELLPTNLTSTIKQYGILPNEIGYAILRDVALALCYLHGQTPPIVHQDLSSNNVLLRRDMTAKISDLGASKILDSVQTSGTTTYAFGTPAYMPPEVMIANPIYAVSIDEFSYGIMMIHVFSGKWPEPQVGPIGITADGQMIPLSEAERRKKFLQIIGDDHPLMDLILKCIKNYPKSRAHADEIMERLTQMVSKFSSSFANRLDMLRYIENREVEERKIQKLYSQDSTESDKSLHVYGLSGGNPISGMFETTKEFVKTKQEEQAENPIMSSSKQISKLHCHDDSIMEGSASIKGEDAKEKTSCDENKYYDKEFCCPCGQCSLQSYLHNGCPESKSGSFPYLDISKLDEYDKEDLSDKLSRDAADMIKTFAELLDQIRVSLQKRGVSPTKLVSRAFSLACHEPPVIQDPLSKEEQMQLMKSKTMDEVFFVLTPCMSFFNFELLQHITASNELCSDNDRRRMGGYIDMFCRHKVFEIPGTVSQTVSKKDERKSFIVLITKYEMKKHLNFLNAAVKQKIAELLGLRPSTLHFHNIDER